MLLNAREEKFWSNLTTVLQYLNDQGARVKPSDLDLSNGEHFRYVMDAYHDSLYPIYKGPSDYVKIHHSLTPEWDQSGKLQRITFFLENTIDARIVGIDSVQRRLCQDLGCNEFTEMKAHHNGLISFAVQGAQLETLQARLEALAVTQKGTLEMKMMSMEELRALGMLRENSQGTDR